MLRDDWPRDNSAPQVARPVRTHGVWFDDVIGRYDDG